MSAIHTGDLRAEGLNGLGTILEFRLEEMLGAHSTAMMACRVDTGKAAGLPGEPVCDRTITIYRAGADRPVYSGMIRRGSVTEENGVQTMRLDMIRSTSDDVVQISHQTGIPEWKIQKIKEHVFYNDHILDDRIGRFDADIDIADAWERLRKGNYNQNDLDLLNHEYYEHRFEKFFDTDYANAHAKTVESGRVWDPDKEID